MKSSPTQPFCKGTDSYRPVRALGLGLLLLLGTSCGSGEEEKPKDLAVPVISLQQQDVHLDKDYVSDIQAVRNVEIRSRTSGFLEGVHVDEGAYVRKGQLLFSLSSAEAQADVSRARGALNSAIAEARTAELEVEKVRPLVEKRIISKTELDVARARHASMLARADEARGAVAHAQNKLSYTQIRAPFDGVMDRIPLKVGSLLEEGTLITSISDVSSALVYFSISENEYLDYLRVKNQQDADTGMQEVQLVLSNGKPYAYPGKVETVVSEFESGTGSIAFRARFPNPEHLLKHGATGKIKLSREVDDALMLPQKAAFEIQDKNYVFVVDGLNKVTVRAFHPQTRIGAFYIVDSGLKVGERVVYEGIQNVKEGMKVAPRMVTLDPLLTKNLF